MKRKRFPWSLLIMGVMCLGLGALIGKTLLQGSATNPRPSDISAARERELKPTHGTDERLEVPKGDYVAGNGVVEPNQRETKVAGQIAGLIEEIQVKEGQFVEKGTILVTLASQNEKAALLAAEADIAAAEADYQKVVRGSRKEDIDAAIADTEAAKARSLLSSGIVERNEKLAKQGAITKDELDRSQRQATSDQFLYKLAAAKKRQALHGSRAEDIQAAKARKMGAISRRDQAQAVLDRLLIRSPMDGQILQIKYRVGEYYNPQGTDPLLILGDTRTLRVRMDVDEREIGKLSMSAAAFVMADAFPGKQFPAKVVEIGKRMGRKNIRTDDPTEIIDTKILEVVLELDPKPTQLIPGLRVQGYITLPAQSVPAKVKP